jgi:uncharacterized alpha/beta hydrolase family protein
VFKTVKNEYHWPNNGFTVTLQSAYKIHIFDIIGSAKGSQISEKYLGEMGKEKRVDVYIEVRKRRGHIFFE